MSIKQIITHPGGAHKDEFLACSVLLALHAVPIARREPGQEDLADPAICVIDVGHEHQPELHNFDHHQFPRDHPPTCSLSLVLQHLNLYEDARQFCDWLEPAEWIDCRGLLDTARQLGVERDVMNQLSSPIDITLLRRFAMTTEHAPGQPIWECMRMIGEDLLGYVKSLRQRLDFIDRHAEFWTLEAAQDPLHVLFLPRTDPLPDEPSMGLKQYIQSQGKTDSVVGLIYPDRRGNGHGLSRFNDDKRLDFTRVASQDDVHFAHTQGFVAKTSALDKERLKELVEAAWVG